MKTPRSLERAVQLALVDLALAELLEELLPEEWEGRDPPSEGRAPLKNPARAWPGERSKPLGAAAPDSA